MGTILRIVKKEYGTEIVRNDNIEELILLLQDLDKKLDGKISLSVDYLTIGGSMEFKYNNFIQWYEENRNHNPLIVELYNSIKNEKVQDGLISFEWF